MNNRSRTALFSVVLLVVCLASFIIRDVSYRNYTSYVASYYPVNLAVLANARDYSWHYVDSEGKTYSGLASTCPSFINRSEFSIDDGSYWNSNFEPNVLVVTLHVCDGFKDDLVNNYQDIATVAIHSFIFEGINSAETLEIAFLSRLSDESTQIVYDKVFVEVLK
ncbi:hypothetical protein KAZ57_02565 [Patescibacteria group bacterium]|nr:hypothetical protein [Patescibacteria group bacterium]